MSEIYVSNGATGILAASVNVFCGDGGELIAFEPAFLGYAPLFDVSGAKTQWVG
jgi:aspartate/methionine/tyrosine aminotransferase